MWSVVRLAESRPFLLLHRRTVMPASPGWNHPSWIRDLGPEAWCYCDHPSYEAEERISRSRSRAAASWSRIIRCRPAPSPLLAAMHKFRGEDRGRIPRDRPRRGYRPAFRRLEGGASTLCRNGRSGLSHGRPCSRRRRRTPGRSRGGSHERSREGPATSRRNTYPLRGAACHERDRRLLLHR